jgi:hypothetical protein
LAGSVFILSLANVVGFAGLGEVPVLRPELHKEVEALPTSFYCITQLV